MVIRKPQYNNKGGNDFVFMVFTSGVFGQWQGQTKKDKLWGKINRDKISGSPKEEDK